MYQSKYGRKKNTVQYLNNDRQLKISMEYLLESYMHEPISRRNTKKKNKAISEIPCTIKKHT